MRQWSEWLGGLLVLTYGVWLFGTLSDLGYARDEGFYFYAAERYRVWFDLLFTTPSRALDPDIIDHYWSVNREHPPLTKMSMVLAHYLLVDTTGLVEASGTAYRAVGVVSAAVTLWTVFVWGRRIGTPRVGVFALLALALMPRYFYHAHLACFDVPVACWWVVAAFVYCRAVMEPGWRWVAAAGLCFGALLSTKHNAWLLPPAIAAHAVVLGVLGQRDHAVKALRVLVGMGLVGPLVLYCAWPFIWHDTWARLTEYVTFHTGHEYYNMEFLGRTYFEPPMPRLYAWLMTLATVPFTTLLLFLVGVVNVSGVWLQATRSAFSFVGAEAGRVRRWATSWFRRCTAAVPPHVAQNDEVVVASSFWLIALLVSYAPWWSTTTPIFGGTKHWITAYPFLALFAGWGADQVLRAAGRLAPSTAARCVLVGGATLALIVPPWVMTLGSHPFGLSFYTPLVGGAPGAANLGLNRTFWGYTTGSLAKAINEQAPHGATLYLHDTARASFEMLQRDGRIRSDIRPTLDIARSTLALYHHEPHMSRVEYQIWVDYGTVSPSAVATYQGVPVAWLYQRPGATSHEPGLRP